MGPPLDVFNEAEVGEGISASVELEDEVLGLSLNFHRNQDAKPATAAITRRTRSHRSQPALVEAFGSMS